MVWRIPKFGLTIGGTDAQRAPERDLPPCAPSSHQYVDTHQPPVPMESLAEHELHEANQYLVRFEEARRVYVIFGGGSLVCTAALPLLLFVFWLIGTESIFRGAIAGVAMLGIGYSATIGWHLRTNSHFRQIRSRCLKLQRAGYFVYKKPIFLRNELGASTDGPKPDVKLLDFEHMTPWDLYYQMV